MAMTVKVRQLVFDGATSTEIRKEAISQGMVTLYRDGIDKVLSGVTTLEEVFRVAKADEDNV